ncbi:MAG: EAL domain-containing protein [Eubacteriales bacterium]|nr:EAL domain-containing protein [Eubacteriales bacterium]
MLSCTAALFIIAILCGAMCLSSIRHGPRPYAAAAGVCIVCAALLWFIVTARVYAAKSRRQLAAVTMIDPLTKGDNSSAFQIKLKTLTSQAPPSTYTLVFLNIKDFQLINENFGVGAGDNTLKYIHSVLKSHIKEDELVCRSEMDHFFLCLKDASEQSVTERVAEIAEAVNGGGAYTGVGSRITLRAGGYLIDNPGLKVITMQDRARAACINAPEDAACAFFGPALLERKKREGILNSIFAASLKHHDFQIYLQPKVRLSDRKLCGAEALVRWRHPEYGMIFPSNFIPLFERNGNICILDVYIFEEVCRLLRSYLDARQALIPISVNLSRSHIKKPNFLREFVEIKKKYQIPDNIIEFELTESIMLSAEHIKLVKNVIGEMHKNGFLCSLDDFGFGYSSLSLLKDLEIDVVKLDKSFFDDVLNPKAESIILGFIEIAHRLGIKVVAEGIETEDQLNSLCRLHCDAVQGYFFSKPLSIVDFEAWSRASGA